MRFMMTCAVTALAAFGLFGAEKPIDVVKIDRKEPIVFEKEIEPILRNKCTVCHSGNQLKGKFDASSYASLMKGSGKRPVIIPNKSAESPLILYAGRNKKPFMPPKDEEPLNPQELALIKLWIDQGAKPPSAAGEKPKIALSAPPANVTPVRAVAVGPDKKEVVAG